MNCESVREGIQDLLDGTLEPAREGEVLAHLRDCADCSRAREEIAHTIESVRRLPEEEPPAEFKTRVMHAIRREGTSRAAGPAGGRLRPLPLRLAAAIGAVALAGVFAWKSIVREGPETVSAADRATLARADEIDATAPAPPAETAASEGAVSSVAPTAPVPQTEPVGGIYRRLEEFGARLGDGKDRDEAARDGAEIEKNEQERRDAAVRGFAEDSRRALHLAQADREGEAKKAGEILGKTALGIEVSLEDKPAPTPVTGSDDFFLGRVQPEAEVQAVLSGSVSNLASPATVYSLQLERPEALSGLKAFLVPYQPPVAAEGLSAERAQAPPGVSFDTTLVDRVEIPGYLVATVPVKDLGRFDESIRKISGIRVLPPEESAAFRFREAPRSLPAPEIPASRPSLRLHAAGPQAGPSSPKAPEAAGVAGEKEQAPERKAPETVEVRLYLIPPPPPPAPK